MGKENNVVGLAHVNRQVSRVWRAVDGEGWDQEGTG